MGLESSQAGIEKNEEKLGELKKKARELEKEFKEGDYENKKEELEEELRETENEIYRMEREIHRLGKGTDLRRKKELRGQDQDESQEKKSESNFIPEHFIPELNMRDKGGNIERNLIKRTYDKLFEDVPGWERAKMGSNRLIKKLKMVFPQFWANRHQKKIVALKGKMGVLDSQISNLKRSQKEMRSSIEDGQAQDIPGIKERLEIGIKEIDRRIDKIQLQKDKIQSKTEGRMNKAKMWINRRDKIADDFINRYETEIRHRENELRKWQDQQMNIELQTEVVEARHSQEMKEINHLGDQKEEMRGILEAAGCSLREIKKSIRPYDDLIKLRLEGIKRERDQIDQRKKRIDQKIAEIDQKISPYRDRLNEFRRIQQQRLIDMKIEKREDVDEVDQRENIKPHFRKKKQKREQDPFYLQSLSPLKGMEKWNEYIDKNFRGEIPFIDREDFFNAVNLPYVFELELGRFLKILKLYYQVREKAAVKKIGNNRLKNRIDEFGKEFGKESV